MRKINYEYIREYKVFGVENGMYNLCLSKVEPEEQAKAEALLNKLIDMGIYEYSGPMYALEEEIEKETLQKVISICENVLKEGVNHTDWEEVSTTLLTLKDDIKVTDKTLSELCTNFYCHIEDYKKCDINNNKHIVLSKMTLEIYDYAATIIKL